MESNNTEHEEQVKTSEAALAAPEFDPDVTIDEQFDWCTVTLNKSASITQLDLMKVEPRFDGKLYPTRAAALSELGDALVIPSMEAVNGWLKPFNDGLYAAVELAADKGNDGVQVNRRELLNQLLRTLIERASVAPIAEQTAAKEAAAHVAGALLASGEEPVLPPDVEATARGLLSEFDNKVFYSRPTAFYGWNGELESLFRSERFMSYSAPSFAAASAIALRTVEQPSLRDAYAGYLSLFEGMTNTFRDQHPLELTSFITDPSCFEHLEDVESQFKERYPSFELNSAAGTHFSLLPASTSPESELIERLADEGKLEDANLFDALIDAIRSGRVDLTPKDGDGFYARQLYALETLLVPERGHESAHLRLTQAYKDKLVATFRSLLVQTRETHARQLSTSDVSVVSAPAVELYPQLPVEPFPTFYLRTARAYFFLEGLLGAVLGETFTSSSHRLIEDGTRAQASLKEELELRQRVLYGLHVVAARSIGMRPELSADEEQRFAPTDAENAARAWLSTWRADPDVSRDHRVIVPITIDWQKNTTHNWAVIGVRAIRMSAKYVEGHEPKVVRSSGCNTSTFGNFQPYLLVDETVEVVRKATAAPLTRTELRKRCDANVDATAIARALEQD